MPSFFVIRKGKETFLFSILCEQRDGSLRRNSVVLKSRANFFQSWNAQRSWCIESRWSFLPQRGRSIVDGRQGDFWRNLRREEKYSLLVPHISILCRARHRLLSLFSKRKRVPAFCLRFHRRGYVKVKAACKRASRKHTDLSPSSAPTTNPRCN